MTTLREDMRNVRRGLTLTEIGVIVSLIISIGTVLFTGGIVYAQVQEHGVSITELKTKDASTTDRLARIETKIDLMLQRRGVEE